MNENTRNEIESLNGLRLPELQARFAEVIGEPTRAPNRAFLIRKITEALESREAAPPASEPEEPPAESASEPEQHRAEPAPPLEPIQAASEAPLQDGAEPSDVVPAAEDESSPLAPSTTDAPAAPSASRVAPRLSKMDVNALRTRYREVVGRDTDSVHRGYLVWKIRQAEKGKIPVGPRSTRRSSAEPQDMKVLPLRMEADLVANLDEARKRLGLRSRMELFRRSLHVFLLEAGEVRVAGLFETSAPAEPEA